MWDPHQYFFVYSLPKITSSWQTRIRLLSAILCKSSILWASWRRGLHFRTCLFGSAGSLVSPLPLQLVNSVGYVDRFSFLDTEHKIFQLIIQYLLKVRTVRELRFGTNAPTLPEWYHGLTVNGVKHCSVWSEENEGMVSENTGGPTWPRYISCLSTHKTSSNWFDYEKYYHIL